MNFKKVAGFVGLMAGSVLAVSTSPAQAFDLNSGSSVGTCAPLTGGYYTGPYGQVISSATAGSCTTNDGFTLTANTGSVLQGKTVGGVKGVGITTNPADPLTDTPGEIDNSEALSLTHATGGIFNYIDLSFLYQPGVYSDEVFEVASIVANDGTAGILRITGNSTAQWIVGGVVQAVTALSNSVEGAGGRYRVFNPFGDKFLTSLTLTAVQQPGVPGNYQNSDYGLVGAQLKSVPEPTTLAGLSIVGGLLVASRRRKANAVS
jgi:hypothetical protein